MRSKPGPFSIAAIVTFAISVCHAEAQPAARNLSGNYRCEPQPASCQTGQTFSVTQSGTNLELKSDKSDHGNARLTSDTTISAGPPWNMVGVVYDGDIQWSNGTKWRKQ